MPDFYDALEIQDPVQRERDLLALLPKQIAHAKQHAPGYARILRDVDPHDVASRAALAELPVTRKSDLQALQAALPPFGGLNATRSTQLAKIFVSPGPINEPAGHAPDWWRIARALHAAGFRRGDLVVNTFAYHFTPAGAMFESGALACGCTVVPAGVGQTEIQVAAIAALRINAYAGTPSFLEVIVAKAVELRADISSLKKALVGAEYLAPALRAAMAERDINVMQCFATADLGLIAYESQEPDGKLCDGMIVDEGILLEIVRPGTGETVPEGEVGEVVVTSFNPDYPLIRFATGDLSAILPGPSPCGRTNIRIKGWLGRADDAIKVKGMFVHPTQVTEVVSRHAEIKRARLIVDRIQGKDRMTLHCEVENASVETVRSIVTSIRNVTKLRGEVALRKPGDLPNDGKLIEDARTYD